MLQLAKYLKNDKLAEQYNEDFLTALDTNLKVIDEASLKGRKANSASFLESSNGVYLIACLYLHKYRDM